jgi:hypothetical protein
MIRTIGSLVQEPLNTKCWFFATSLYTLACISTSILLGTSLSVVGLLVHSVISAVDQHGLLRTNVEDILIGGLAIVYALSDFGLFRLPRPTLMNAVPVTWWRKWRPYGGALTYGAALGLGMTTRIHFGAFYILCIWCMFKGNLLYGAILMGLYGAVRALVLFPTSRYIYGSCANSASSLSRLTLSLETAKVIVGVVLILFGTYTVVSIIL